MDPMLERGELPNLARLIRTGVRAPLRSRMPLWSPAVWTTVATGVPRERHGISRFENANGDLSASLDRRAPALWTIASAAGRRCAVIGWWVTYPAESVNGVIVSERALRTRDADLREMLDQPDAHAQAKHLIYPPEAVPMISDILGSLPAEAPAADDADRVVLNMRAEDRTVAQLLMRLRQRAGPFDLEMALLRGVDPVSHHFWKYHEPGAPAYGPAERPTADDVQAHGDTIPAHYRYVDALLGTLDVGTDPDQVVIIISDHGFEAGQQPFRGGTLSGTHESKAALYGILIAQGGPIRRGAAVDGARIADIAPTVLHLLGLPVAQDLGGKILEAMFDPAWWSSHPPRTVPSYAGPAVNLPEGAGATARESPVDDKLRDQLRALGYLE
jgi:predicted AlkP superfamily phosphohydrolase/phosphomutase